MHKVKSNGTIKQLPEVGEALGWKEFFYGQGNDQKVYVTKVFANADNTDSFMWNVTEPGLYYVKYTFSTLGETSLGTHDVRSLSYRQFSAILCRGNSQSPIAVSGLDDTGSKEFTQEVSFIYPLRVGDSLYPQVWTDKAGIKVYVRFFAAKITI